ncbi:MAG: hypothetical protein J7L39_00860, partial [Candidatus Aenigmarchaeota archaeon]|nr:hypothetical protein [Candidatus Aenigmarchaeota archaeon]
MITLIGKLILGKKARKFSKDLKYAGMVIDPYFFVGLTAILCVLSTVFVFLIVNKFLSLIYAVFLSLMTFASFYFIPTGV